MWVHLWYEKIEGKVLATGIMILLGMWNASKFFTSGIDSLELDPSAAEGNNLQKKNHFQSSPALKDPSLDLFNFLHVELRYCCG